MTNEEAIAELKEDIDLYIPTNGTIEEVDRDLPDGRLVTALEMGINALEKHKTAHWVYELEDWNKWTCSECGWSKRTDVHIRLGYNYCPNCGARMEAENGQNRGD